MVLSYSDLELKAIEIVSLDQNKVPLPESVDYFVTLFKAKCENYIDNFICLYNSNYICNKTGLKRTKCSHIRLLNIESILEARPLFSVMLLTFGKYDRKKGRRYSLPVKKSLNIMQFLNNIT